MSPQQSKLSVETRTPTAWGEARSFLEFDFAGDTAASERPMATSNNLHPACAMPMALSVRCCSARPTRTSTIPTPAMESLEFGGLIGDTGPSRMPQIRWTQPLGGLGPAGRAVGLGGGPETDIWAPGAGVSSVRARARPSSLDRGCNGPFAGLSATAVNPLKNTAPEMVAAWYIPQPWGHVDFAAVVRPMLRVQTPFGAGVDRTYVG